MYNPVRITIDKGISDEALDEVYKVLNNIAEKEGIQYRLTIDPDPIPADPDCPVYLAVLKNAFELHGCSEWLFAYEVAACPSVRRYGVERFLKNAVDLNHLKTTVAHRPSTGEWGGMYQFMPARNP